jgi:hypothetical protein
MIAPKPELVPSLSKVQQHWEGAATLTAFVLAHRFSVAKYAFTFVDPVRLNRLLSRDIDSYVPP